MATWVDARCETTTIKLSIEDVMTTTIATATIHIHNFVVVFDLLKTNFDDPDK